MKPRPTQIVHQSIRHSLELHVRGSILGRGTRRHAGRWANLNAAVREGFTKRSNCRTMRHRWTFQKLFPLDSTYAPARFCLCLRSCCPSPASAWTNRRRSPSAPQKAIAAMTTFRLTTGTLPWRRLRMRGSRMSPRARKRISVPTARCWQTSPLVGPTSLAGSRTFWVERPACPTSCLRPMLGFPSIMIRPTCAPMPSMLQVVKTPNGTT